MRYLIFEYQYEGHYIEYIRHILWYAKEYQPCDEFHIVVPNKYEKHLDSFPTSDKIFFHFLSDKILKRLSKTGKLSIITHSFVRCRTVAEYIKHYNIDKTILITSINYLFGIGLIIPQNSYISAIEYIIPRHRPDNISSLKKLEDRFRMWTYSHTKQLKNIFLLNDEDSAEIYNNNYRTSKFKFLPDPIDCIVNSNEYSAISNRRITILHAGRFRKEKGTFDIFEALRLLDDNERSKFKFILCGESIVPEDNERAKKEILDLSNIMDVEYHPGFVSEKFLHNLYVRSDYVLMPYHNYFQSSGNLGHAASYRKPVIGPGDGLLGNLIEKYSLGITLESLDATGIVKALRKILTSSNSKSYRFNDYVRRCSPYDFSRILLS